MTSGADEGQRYSTVEATKDPGKILEPPDWMSVELQNDFNIYVIYLGLHRSTSQDEAVKSPSR